MKNNGITCIIFINYIKMAQPIKNSKLKKVDKRKSTKNGCKKKSNQKWLSKEKKHPEYGTSKLETRFSKNFLDKLGVKYIYQFKMESIGRYLDFYLPDENVAIEIDGDYYHSYGKLYEEMSPMQKHNHRVDKQKDHWCMINGVKLIRIWEHDINKNPTKVMNMLTEELHYAKINQDKKNNMKKRH